MNKATENAILALNEKHPNAIAIFGGALYAQSIDDIISMLPNIIRSAKFFGWHETPAETCRTFCHLCFVDPMLVEVYIGTRFEQLVA